MDATSIVLGVITPVELARGQYLGRDASHYTSSTQSTEGKLLWLNIKKPLAAALGAAFLATSIAPLASAAANPFSAQQLSGGYDLPNYDKHGEGKCGEGKCGEGKAGEGTVR